MNLELKKHLCELADKLLDIAEKAGNSNSLQVLAYYQSFGVRACIDLLEASIEDIEE